MTVENCEVMPRSSGSRSTFTPQASSVLEGVACETRSTQHARPCSGPELEGGRGGSKARREGRRLTGGCSRVLSSLL